MGSGKIIYWHREVPPIDAELLGSTPYRLRAGMCQVRLLTETSCGINATVT